MSKNGIDLTVRTIKDAQERLTNNPELARYVRQQFAYLNLSQQEMWQSALNSGYFVIEDINWQQRVNVNNPWGWHRCLEHLC